MSSIEAPKKRIYTHILFFVASQSGYVSRVSGCLKSRYTGASRESIIIMSEALALFPNISSNQSNVIVECSTYYIYNQGSYTFSAGSNYISATLFMNATSKSVSSQYTVYPFCISITPDMSVVGVTADIRSIIIQDPQTNSVLGYYTYEESGIYVNITHGPIAFTFIVYREAA